MPNWGTRYLSEYEVSTEDASLSGQQGFSLAGSGGALLTPQSGIIGFTIALAQVGSTISDSSTQGFTLSATGVGAFSDKGQVAFTIFPQARGGAIINDSKAKKDGDQILTIR